MSVPVSADGARCISDTGEGIFPANSMGEPDVGGRGVSKSIFARRQKRGTKGAVSSSKGKKQRCGRLTSSSTLWHGFVQKRLEEVSAGNGFDMQDAAMAVAKTSDSDAPHRKRSEKVACIPPYDVSVYPGLYHQYLEIANTELNYTRVLRKLYKLRARGMLMEFFTEKEARTLFSPCLRDLYDFHKQLTLLFFAPARVSMVQIFSVLTTEKAKQMYKKYVSNYPKAIALARKLECSDFRELIRRRNIVLENLLIEPIQRLARYPLLFEAYFQQMVDDNVMSELKDAAGLCKGLKTLVEYANS
eukprot:CAMPEP_0119149978 /NCGR_PEP_ID=MMETSP1310-20130426/44128_1 /TAXON_ID=464262 /ORGANISM="Genus nov. species nov., Strain RCC2339" /LENGTH=301 /DNA_ID=CAMNT_0007142121 /DNA_START=1 /DNA_END=909 /DNA_ORIENTATION=-